MLLEKSQNTRQIDNHCKFKVVASQQYLGFLTHFSNPLFFSTLQWVFLDFTFLKSRSSLLLHSQQQTLFPISQRKKKSIRVKLN